MVDPSGPAAYNVGGRRYWRCRLSGAAPRNSIFETSPTPPLCQKGLTVRRPWPEAIRGAIASRVKLDGPTSPTVRSVVSLLPQSIG